MYVFYNEMYVVYIYIYLWTNKQLLFNSETLNE